MPKPRKRYGRREQTRREHLLELQEVAGASMPPGSPPAILRPRRHTTPFATAK
jgi:hypothetical protein